MSLPAVVLSTFAKCVRGEDHEIGAQRVVEQRLAEVTEGKGRETAFVELFLGFGSR